MFWLKGLLIGLVASAPLGPIGFICLNYAISQGFRLAILAGLGAALADVLFASISGFGLYGVTDWFQQNYLYIGTFGGLFLMGLGIHLLRSHPIELQTHIDHKSEAEAFLSTFIFTLSNPVTILVFTTLICCYGPKAETTSETLAMLSGVFIGAMIWWTSLSLVGTYTRHHVSFRALNLTRKATAYGVILFGIFATATALFYN